jgi:hypothetical protein
MAKLECKNCGNTKTWRSIVISNGHGKAVCDCCGHTTETSGGVEVDTVVGQMVMNSPRKRA